MTAELPVRLAIVGSTQYAKDHRAAQRAAVVIQQALHRYRPVLVISGGAEGIDTMAAFAAEEAGIEVREHLPKNRRWAPAGFKDRNILIANDCTHLLAIRHPASKTYGSGWTADYAESHGRIVERITIGPER